MPMSVLFPIGGVFFQGSPQGRTLRALYVRSISEISSCFLGPRPWHIEVRHRVNKTSTINLFGFETLNLKIRRLKLWKPTVYLTSIVITMRIYDCTYGYIHIYIYICIHIHIYVYTVSYVYIYIYIHTHTHYKCTHIYDALSM